jgi:hypothetical protein
MVRRTPLARRQNLAAKWRKRKSKENCDLHHLFIGSRVSYFKLIKGMWNFKCTLESNSNPVKGQYVEGTIWGPSPSSEQTFSIFPKRKPLNSSWYPCLIVSTGQMMGACWMHGAEMKMLHTLHTLHSTSATCCFQITRAYIPTSLLCPCTSLANAQGTDLISSSSQKSSTQNQHCSFLLGHMNSP